MILIGLIALTFVVGLVFALVVMLSGFWMQRPKADFDRIDEMEKETGIGPPYSSEFPKLRKQTEERIW